jgi:drug/metabolite transporter (DMT)-like permease
MIGPAAAWERCPLMSPVQTAILTSLAMVAFAANSVLCRLALGAGLIDAATFTSIRVLAGAAVLALVLASRRRATSRRADWRSVLALFVYMAFFSFAYLSLSAGTGALVLFGAVQLTMFTVALRRGEQFSPVSWFGLALALAGLVYLVAPGVRAPDPLGAALMAVAGIAWGVYSLFGRSATDPAVSTAWNFIYSVPLVLVMSLLFVADAAVTVRGALLAAASGAIASGLGYVTWYAALRGLAATSAATVQLSAPVLAAIGGVVLLAEDVSLRLVLASIATLGGVAVVLLQRGRRAPQAESGSS